jgi:hypothetical protein
MKHATVKGLIVTLLGLTVLSLGTPALAWHHHHGVRFGVFIGPPLFGPYWWYPPPRVYYDPPPVIYREPVVVAPPVVQPQPSYTPPPAAPGNGVIELGPAPAAGAPSQAPPPAIAQPPAGAPPQGRMAQAGQVYVYPRQGQSPQQQAADEATCNSWASTQMGSGFDANQAVSSFQRALAACLDAHGYSVR